MQSHATNVCRRDTGRSCNSGLNTTLPQPLRIEIDCMRCAAPRLAGEEYVESRFENGERFVLRHRPSVSEGYPRACEVVCAFRDNRGWLARRSPKSASSDSSRADDKARAR